MKFSLNWLKEYVNISITTDELVNKLVMAGHEVEEIIELGHELKNVVTGKILSIEKHPDADKLVITQISDGTTEHQIVTGANNISVGDIVPVAIPGAVLHKGFKIKASKLRGVPSNGMLCSETELGLTESSNGIWILDKEIPVGVDFISYASLRDTILDVSILPNRGDCQSIYGLARDLSVVLNTPLKKLEISVNLTEASSTLSFSNEGKEFCDRYTGRIIRNIKPTETPLKIKRFLQGMGVGTINFVVDITNYVLLETGQPLHAFDFSHVNGYDVSCKQANSKEKIKGLDSKTYELNTEDYVIAIDGKAQAIAGLIGGDESSVKESTSDIFLEAANFRSAPIRKAQQRHGLRTESSIRFEKGTDVEAVERASARAAHLYQKYAGAVVESLAIDYKKEGVGSSSSIKFSYRDITQLIGLNLSNQDIDNPLRQLGFEIENGRVFVPSWRVNDCVDWPCLAEEVLRINGFDGVPEVLPLETVVPSKKERKRELRDLMSNFMISNGFNQVVSFPMISPKVAVNQDLVIKNPISSEESVMRADIRPELLRIAEHNLKRQQEHLKLFEVGKGFSLVDNQPKDTVFCEGICTGALFGKSYQKDVAKIKGDDYFVLKGYLVTCFKHIGFNLEFLSVEEAKEEELKEASLKNKGDDSGAYIPGKHTYLTVNKKVVGEFGILHPNFLDTYDISDQVSYFKLNITILSKLNVEIAKYRPFSKFPSTRRDIALVIPKTLAYDKIERFVETNKPRTLKKTFIFDVFESDKIGSDNRSIGLAFVYQNDKKTLEDKDVNRAHDKLSERLLKEFNLSSR
ncbi:phenylalanine--tRNA ligase subunit beta [bacterium]|jgi:phenylalanyl-tRNA synthetase beta chain|nr:phenylalanine--tRNA ligase subunit beta [bacterium]